VWNKKYPIRIELAKQDDFMSKAEGDHSETTHERTTATGEATVGTEEAKRSGGPELTLYLFGRTGREKEEWHRRILLASKPPKTGMKRVTGLQGSKTGEWMDPGATHSLTDQHTHLHTHSSVLVIYRKLSLDSTCLALACLHKYSVTM
jgi:hypothetical protein